MSLTTADDRLAAEYESFRAAFKRSRRSNLWASLDGGRVTASVFARSDGGYSWCVANSVGPSYSPHRFETEADALEDLWLFVRDL